MASTRRLAAILAADVAGYSRLMGADEEGTHERLKAHLGELVDPKIGEHRGRVVKNTGDGLLAECPSVVDGVRCAVEVQRGMLGREPEVAEERSIRFRIGITQASKASVMSIAANADHQLLRNGRSPSSFLGNKNRFRESQRLNTFGLERVYRKIPPDGARAKIPPTPCAPSLAGLV